MRALILGAALLASGCVGGFGAQYPLPPVPCPIILLPTGLCWLM